LSDENNKKLLDVIAGARPNFMKIAPILAALNKRISGGTKLSFRLVHTGQHYDDALSKDFFTQLGIPEPDVNLAVGSGSQAEQTANIMVRYESLIKDKRCDMCLVVGDVNSTMACAIVAKKEKIPVAHVEAGIRSYDLNMPEEINRMVTDSITDWFFTTSKSAGENLLRSGIPKHRIVFVGNTMIDTLSHNLDRLVPPRFWREHGLQERNYYVLTLHRPSNVDGLHRFGELINEIGNVVDNKKVIFPVHPRTKSSLEALKDVPENIILVEPQPYLEFNYLVKLARAVITDSGGITEEATFLGVPCLTLRDTTERPETITIGTNELIGTDHTKLGAWIKLIDQGKWKIGAIPEKWDGRSAERIVAQLELLLCG
jgi:UDP-N-acetylglucosamine 2-epimerase (non-hydrolysing)